MIIIVLKLSVLIILGRITFEDYKYRGVSLYLFIALLGIGGYLNYYRHQYLPYLEILLNYMILFIMIGIAYIYAKFKMKVSFFNHAYGFGDLLFFGAFAFFESTKRFITLYICCLLFTFITHLIINLREKKKTIPLAGYSALFLLFFYSAEWILKLLG